MAKTTIIMIVKYGLYIRVANCEFHIRLDLK